jgi:hypothetical protein
MVVPMPAPKPGQRLVVPALAATLLALIAGACSQTFIVTRTRAQLQDAIGKRFPVTKEITLVKVTLKNPTVLLRKGDRRIGIQLDAEVSAPLVGTERGQIAAMGEPFYDPDQKAFFLRHPTVERLDVAHFAVARHEAAREALSAVAQAALENTPVYRLEGRDADERKAELFLKDVYVEDEKLNLRLGP